MESVAVQTARQPYPAYRESGIPWLGEVPVGWEIKRLKHVAWFGFSGVDKKSSEGEEAVLLCNYTDVYKNERITDSIDFMAATASDREIAQYTLKRGDVILTKDSEAANDIGVPAIVEEDYPGVVCGYHLAVVRCNNELVSGFLLRLIQSLSTRQRFEALARGVTRFGLGLDDLGNLELPLPPLSEQQAIADYLDRACERIDAARADLEALIERLTEYRTALITRAVTKGLDLTAPIKDSGIPWLGEIPGHWGVRRIKSLWKASSYGTSESFTGGGAIRIVGMTHIQEGRVELPDEGSTDDLEDEYLLEPGDLLFNRTNSLAHVGKVAIVPNNLPGPVGFVSYLVRLRVIESEANATYLNYLLNSKVVLGEARSLAYPSVNQANLNPNRYGEIKIALPPLSEQQAIADYLDERCARIDQSLADARQQLTTLADYRTSLITAAVTGKIDVRETQLA